MTSQRDPLAPTSHGPAGARGLAAGWSAIGAAALALFAWAACCVLPLALSVAGVSLAGTALLAGQRIWLTLVAAIVLGAGWWSVWRRRRACALNAACAPPSRATLVLLTIASFLVVLALTWQPLIEPKALMWLRGLRG